MTARRKGSMIRDAEGKLVRFVKVRRPKVDEADAPEHKRLHGKHPPRRRCGTATSIIETKAHQERDRPLLGMPRLELRADGDEYGWRLIGRARAMRKRRARNRVAARSRARNRR